MPNDRRAGRAGRIALGLALPLLALAGLAGAARAEPPADPARGHALATLWCSKCHVVAPDEPGGDAGPSFAGLASLPETTDEGLTAWLFAPHEPMPDLDLPPAEIRDIVAHIRSLAP